MEWRVRTLLSKELKMAAMCLLIIVMLLSSTVKLGSAQTSSDLRFDNALEWVLKSKMVVDNPSDPIYDQTTPPMGGVFLNFNIDNGQFVRRIHVPSAAEYVKLTSDLAKIGYEENVITRLKRVSDFLLASTATVSLDNRTVTVVAPVWLYKENVGWVPIVEEFYTRDTLNVAQALLQAYQVTKFDGYASKAKELLDTAIFLQSLEDEEVKGGELPQWTSGSLPWMMYNYEARSNYEVTFKDLDLSLTDVIWGALTLGYNILGDEKYLNSRDRYFEFISRSYQQSENIRYPYQFISDRAGGGLYFANFNSVDKEWGPQEPFTTDMGFYQVTGLLINENENLKILGRKFLNELSLLQKGFYFEDSYYPNGEPVGYGNATLDTAQYLAVLKLEENDVLNDQITEAIFQLQLHDSTDVGRMVYNGAWEWSPGSGLVESMATIITIHSLIISPSMIPKTVVHTHSPILFVSVALAIIAILASIIFLARSKLPKPSSRK